MKDRQQETIPVTEAAARLGVTRSTVYEAIRRGELPGIKIGTRTLIPRAPFEKLIGGEQTETPTPTVDVKALAKELRIKSLLLQRDAIDRELAELTGRPAVRLIG